jgi:hypothetical protein
MKRRSAPGATKTNPVELQPASPPSAQVRGIALTAHKETRSFLAVVLRAERGRHAVVVDWLNEPASASPASPAELGPRSLTVWTTEVAPRPATHAPNVP